MDYPILTIVGLGDGVGGGRQLVELAGVVGVPDVGGVLVDARAALVDRNHAADAESVKFANALFRLTFYMDFI